MTIRNIIRIDEEKCNGCGNCITGCVEGALALVDGKAKLVKESYCDGLGACIGECPTDALTIETREAESFDEAATAEHMEQTAKHASVASHAHAHHGGACPGSAQRQFARKHGAHAVSPCEATLSELTHWPIQLHLANPVSPAFQQDDVVIAADCTAFAHGTFHQRFLRAHSLLIACPKLDDTSGYLDKLTALFREANPRSVTVVRMEVPCCASLTKLAIEARKAAGSNLPVREVTIGVEGNIVSEEELW